MSLTRKTHLLFFRCNPADGNLSKPHLGLFYDPPLIPQTPRYLDYHVRNPTQQTLHGSLENARCSQNHKWQTIIELKQTTMHVDNSIIF